MLAETLSFTAASPRLLRMGISSAACKAQSLWSIAPRKHLKPPRSAFRCGCLPRWQEGGKDCFPQAGDVLMSWKEKP